MDWHKFYFKILFLLLPDLFTAQTQQDGVYRGKYLNKFNTYHTQILGEVYIVDAYTVFIKGFTYDGKSRDAYFIVGSSLRPNNEGTIVANEEGKTNVLVQYISKDITLKLPKKVTELTWLAIYDMFKLRTLADVSIPEGFEPPSPQTINAIAGHSHGVSSDAITVFDSKTLHIPNFSYDGTGSEVYFWIGKGNQPNKDGRKIPDENGYLSPLHPYTSANLVLELPGNVTVNENNWFSIWDVETQQSYGSFFIPQDMNIPPALMHIIPRENRLPNCEQLHKNLQVSWEIFGPQITIELAGMIGENDYMTFGISGSTERSQMIDADVALTYIDSWMGLTVDYNAAEKAPCTKTVDAFRGTCPDLKVGGLDDFQFIMHERTDNVTIINYRRNLISPDPKDKNYTDSPMYIVWAVGHLSSKKEPLFHYLYPKGNIKLNFGRKPATKNCNYFTKRMKTLDTIQTPTWEAMTIKDKNINKFSATLGPSGGRMGYESFTGQPSQQLSWYVNGLLAPEIYVKRNEKYTFVIQGGSDINSPIYNNPFYISNDPEGGHDQHSSDYRKRVRIYAGVNFDRRDDPIPFAAGQLCRWENRNLDLRLLDQFPSFGRFRQKLKFICDGGTPGILEWIPNKTTPNIVYYQSYKQPYMGWKIHVVDYFPESGSNRCIDINNYLFTLQLMYLIFNFIIYSHI